MKQVEEDAVNFKPMGTKIHSYVRKKGSHKGKDPRERAIGKSKNAEVHEDEEGAITYEVYHVGSISLYLMPLLPVLTTLIVPGQLGYTRILRIPPADADFHSSLHRSRVIHPRGRGEMGVCYPVGILSLLVNGIDRSFARSFERRKRKDGTHVYHFIGYSSLYPFYFYPESTRLRLR